MNITDRDVFIFLNRKHNTMKLLQWDGDGFALYEKRLARGTFEYKIEEGKTLILLTP